MGDGESLPTLRSAIAGTPQQINGTNSHLFICFWISDKQFQEHSMRDSEWPPTLRVQSLVLSDRQAEMICLWSFTFRSAIRASIGIQ